MRELTLRVAAEEAEEVLDSVLPALPGGAHLRESGETVEITVQEAEGWPDEGELRRLAGSRLIAVASHRVSDDWRERRLARYQPLVVAERFLLRPDWAPPGDDAGLIEIVLAQSSAFGTGLHPTTQACLATLAELEPGGSLADVGCGSGILSIAAARLGWKPVLAVDVEPSSVAAAQGNAERNGVGVEVSRVDVSAEEPPAADTVVANIPPPVQVGLAARIGAPPRTLIASGFKPNEIADVAGAWEARGLRIADEVRANEWSVLVMEP